MQELLHRREIEQLPEVLARYGWDNYYPQSFGGKLSLHSLEGSMSHEGDLTQLAKLAPYD